MVCYQSDDINQIQKMSSKSNGIIYISVALISYQKYLTPK